MNSNSRVFGFSGERLKNRRCRRGLTKKGLSELSKVNQRLISDFEKGKIQPSELQVNRLATALKSSLSYFLVPWNQGVSEATLSFRAPSKMSQRNKKAAVAYAQDAVDLYNWIDSNYNCPASQLPDYSYISDPVQAALMTREAWGLGQAPIGNMVSLLESHGIFLFAAETDNGLAFDAFSFISDSRPYICLGKRKTPERDRFDLAHELGHLVLHQDDKTPTGKEKEREANQFASYFLMPKDDVLAEVPYNPSLASLKQLKIRWGVSATALVYHLRQMELITEWIYHSYLVQLAKEGYRSGEPNGMKEMEKSIILDAVLRDVYATHSLRKITTATGQTYSDIAELANGLAITVAPCAPGNWEIPEELQSTSPCVEGRLQVIRGGKVD